MTLSCDDGTQVTWTGGDPAPTAMVLEGSYTIASSLDVLLLQGVTEISGILTIDAPGLVTR